MINLKKNDKLFMIVIKKKRLLKKKRLKLKCMSYLFRNINIHFKQTEVNLKIDISYQEVNLISKTFKKRLFQIHFFIPNSRKSTYNNNMLYDKIKILTKD
jgi:hypothetical protein